MTVAATGGKVAPDLLAGVELMREHVPQTTRIHYIITNGGAAPLYRLTGATWTPLGVDLDAVLGPYFGKSESHFMVVGKKGFQETKDGGKTWQVAAPLPAGFGVGRVGPNYAWDPNADILYASSMGKPTFKYQR